MDASAPSVVAWHVETDPHECERDRSFAREVDIACRAAGGACRLDEGEASPVAVLHCVAEGAWILELRGPPGEALRLSIEGEDRFAAAALAVARVRPEPVGSGPAAAELASIDRMAPVDRSPPIAPVPARLAEKRGGVSLAARAVLGSGFDPGLGMRAAAAAGVGPFAAGVTMSGERGLSAPSGYGYWVARAGASFAFGAPWGSPTWGLAVEAGGMYGLLSAPAGSSPGTRGFVHPYAQLSLNVRPVRAEVWRPYVGLSLLAHIPSVHVTSAGADVANIPALSVALDAGVACPTW